MENITTITNCAICYSELLDLNEVKRVCPKSNPTPSTSSSSDQGHLKSQLNVIFFLRQIFELDRNQMEGYLRKWGDPGTWLRFCGGCEDDVNNIRSLYQRLHQISRELERRKCILEERVMDSKSEKPGVVGEVGNECRRTFYRKYTKRRLDMMATVNPFEKGDLLATALALEIKVEDINNHNDPTSSIDYYDYANQNLETFHDENSWSNESSKDYDHDHDAVISEDHQPTSSSESEMEDIQPVPRPSSSSRCNRIRPSRLRQVKYSQSNEGEDDANDGHEKDEDDATESKPRKRNPSRKTTFYCPLCRWHSSSEAFYTLSRHLQSCAASISSSTKLESLRCFTCKKMISCSSSNKIKDFMEHVALCRDRGASHIQDQDGPPIPIPWRHTVIQCNLCSDSIFLPFPDFTKHIFKFHQHQYGCTQCPIRARQSGTISGAHWKAYHKNLTDTPRKERYSSLPEGTSVPFPEIPWWCPVTSCLQQFPDEASRDLHVLNCAKIFPMPERNFSCGFCGRNYFHEEELLMHRVIVHGYLHQENGHKCTEFNCNEIFKNSASLAKHLRIRHGLNLFKCKECGAEFQTSDLLGSHLRLEHSKKEDLQEFTCSYCDTIFGQRHQLRRHISKVHEKVKKICEICGKECENEESWKYHLATFHPRSRKEEVPHPCQVPGCGEILKSALGLKQHLSKYHSNSKVSQSRIREFMCSFCGKLFKIRRALKLHTKECRPSQFKCGKCDKIFATRKMLMHHRYATHRSSTRNPGRPPLNQEKTKLKKKEDVKVNPDLDLSKVTLSEDKTSGSCNICQKNCDTIKKLKFHMALFHDDKKAVSCPYPSCGATLPNKFHLQIHMAKVHGEGWKCEVCDQVFASKYRLEQHQNGSCNPESGNLLDMSKVRHSADKSLGSCDLDTIEKLKSHMALMHDDKNAATCIICNINFANNNLLRNHLAKVHQVGEKCEVCKKVFSTQTRLEKHKIFYGHYTSGESLTVSLPFKCTWESCGKCFRTNKMLLNHIYQCHKRANERTCTICGVKRATSQSMRSHMKSVHGNDKNRECPICKRTFMNNGAYKMHMKSHSSQEKAKNYISGCCDICGLIVSQKGHLPEHKARVHGIGEFKCDVEGCLKAFRKKEKLEDHKKYTHEGLKKPKEVKEKTKSCQFCGKVFAKTPQLKRHEDAMHRNAESKPFKCDLCEKAFSVKAYLSYHLTYTHKIKKPV